VPNLEAFGSLCDIYPMQEKGILTFEAMPDVIGSASSIVTSPKSDFHRDDPTRFYSILPLLGAESGL
jgi:hypothetical protein